MVKSYDIVGYTFNAEILCPYCVAKMYQKVPAITASQVEVCLDLEAKFQGIDRYDETTFDSNEFPKVVFADDVGGNCNECDTDHCSRCNERLV